MLRIGVLASHQGTNFEAICKACTIGEIDGIVTILICNNSSAPVIDRARHYHIQTAHLSSRTHADAAGLDLAIVDTLRSAQVDLVVLAGYMKELGKHTLSTWRDRLINVHPALLPRYGGKGMYGKRVHEAVLENGDKETGVTVHQVVGDYDTGPVVLQEHLPVLSDDTPASLAARVRELEHKALIRAINQLGTGIKKCQSE